MKKIMFLLVVFCISFLNYAVDFEGYFKAISNEYTPKAIYIEKIDQNKYLVEFVMVHELERYTATLEDDKLVIIISDKLIAKIKKMIMKSECTWKKKVICQKMQSFLFLKLLTINNVIK